MQSTITDFRYYQKRSTNCVGPSVGRSLHSKNAFKSLQLGWPYIWPCLQHKYQQNQQTELVHPSVGPSVKKRHADSRGHATYLVGWSFHRSVGPSIYRRTHISAFCHPNIDGILIPKSAGSVHAKFKFVNYKLAPPKAKLHEGVCSHWTKNSNYCNIS